MITTITPNAPQSTANDTSAVVSDESIVAKMTAMREQTLRNQMRTTSDTATGAEDSAESSSPVEPEVSGSEDDTVLTDSMDEATVEAECITFLKQYIKAGISPMCGNTIGQDRRFMAKYMPKLEAYFHYRSIDVSTLKELCKRWHPELVKGFTKNQAHTALADIEESIEELKYYRDKFIVPLPKQGEVKTQKAFIS